MAGRRAARGWAAACRPVPSVCCAPGALIPLANAGLQYSGILFSVFYGALLFGDRLSWMAFAGMLLIVASGLASTWLGRAPAAAKAAPES